MLAVTLIFVAFVLLIVLSWKSLRNPRSHGFFRFFAFESVLVLILVNMDAWFADPFSFFQILSWFFLAASLFMALHGFFLLSSAGKPAQTANIEKTTQLVKAGAYKYIRHPMYASLLYFGIGAFLKDMTLLPLSILFILGYFLVETAHVEEKENLEKFGEQYEDYMAETKMFVPFLF